jgi:hypothetical protein
MQIKEIRPDAARSGYSVRCKPFGRMGFRRTIRTPRLAGAKGLQFPDTRSDGFVR